MSKICFLIEKKSQIDEKKDKNRKTKNLFFNFLVDFPSEIPPICDGFGRCTLFQESVPLSFLTKALQSFYHTFAFANNNQRKTKKQRSRGQKLDIFCNL